MKKIQKIITEVIISLIVYIVLAIWINIEDTYIKDWRIIFNGEEWLISLGITSITLIIYHILEYRAVKKSILKKEIENKAYARKYHYALSKLDIIGLTMIRKYSNENLQKEYNQDEKESSLAPFFIKSSYKFSIDIPAELKQDELEVIKMSCGLGKLVIFLTEYTMLYNQTPLEKPSQPYMVLIIVGKNGLYTLLKKKELDKNGNKSMVFSSKDSMQKEGIKIDNIPPIYWVRVNLGFEDKYDISFGMTFDENKEEYESSTKYTFHQNEVEKILVEQEFDVTALNLYKKETLKGTIVMLNKDEGYFVLETKESVQRLVFINELTRWNKKMINVKTLWLLLEENPNIEVEFNSWFPGYDPLQFHAEDITGIKNEFFD